MLPPRGRPCPPRARRASRAGRGRYVVLAGAAGALRGSFMQTAGRRAAVARFVIRNLESKAQLFSRNQRARFVSPRSLGKSFARNGRRTARYRWFLDELSLYCLYQCLLSVPSPPRPITTARECQRRRRDPSAVPTTLVTPGHPAAAGRDEQERDAETPPDGLRGSVGFEHIPV